MTIEDQIVDDFVVGAIADLLMYRRTHTPEQVANLINRLTEKLNGALPRECERICAVMVNKGLTAGEAVENAAPSPQAAPVAPAKPAAQKPNWKPLGRNQRR